MRIVVCFLLTLLFVKGLCHGDPKVEVVGVGECVDCEDFMIEPSRAVKGLRVTINCKAPKGLNFKTRAAGELDEEGHFKISLPTEIVEEDGKLKEECYAQLESSSAAPCPARDGIEHSRLVFKEKSEDGQRHVFGLAENLRFSPTLCGSDFFRHHFNKHPKLTLPPSKGFAHHPLVDFPPKVKILPPFSPIHKNPLPPHKKPLPPPLPVYKKPLSPPVTVYEKPLPPPMPFYKKPLSPPVTDYEKPLPPPVPFYKKPLSPPVTDHKKSFPPPMPVYKKPLPPPETAHKKPFPPLIPVYKKPLFSPVPVYRKPFPPPAATHRHLPPISRVPKKPCPPIPKITKKPFPPIHKPLPPFPKHPKLTHRPHHHHHKLGKFPPHHHS